MPDELDALIDSTLGGAAPADDLDALIDSALAAPQPQPVPGTLAQLASPTPPAPQSTSLFDPETGMRKPVSTYDRMVKAGSAWGSAMAPPVADPRGADFVGRQLDDLLAAVTSGEQSGRYQREGMLGVKPQEGKNPWKTGALAALGIPSDILQSFAEASGKAAMYPAVAMGDNPEDPRSLARGLQRAGEGAAYIAPGAALKMAGGAAGALEDIIGTTKPFVPLEQQAVSMGRAFRNVPQGMGETPSALQPLAQGSGALDANAPIGGILEDLTKAQKMSRPEASPVARAYGSMDEGPLMVEGGFAEPMASGLTPTDVRAKGYEGLVKGGGGPRAKLPSKATPASLPATPAPITPIETQKIVSDMKAIKTAEEATPTHAIYSTPAEVDPIQGAGIRESRFAAALRVSDTTDPLVKAELNRNPRMHDIAHEQDTIAQASKLTSAEKTDLLYKSSGPLDRVSAAAGHLLMDEKFAAGDMAGGMRDMDQLIVRLTETGQGTEIIRAFRQMQASPGAFAFWADRAYRSSREAVVADFAARFPELKGIGEGGIKQLAESATPNPASKAAQRAVKELEKYTLPPEEMNKLMEARARIEKLPPGIEQEIETAKLMKQVSDKTVRRGAVNQALATVDALHVVSILGNIKTPFRNVLGNSIMVIADNLRARAAAAIDWARSSLTGSARQRFAPADPISAIKAGFTKAKRESMAINAGVDLDAYAEGKFGSDSKGHIRFEGPTPQAALQAWSDYSLRVPDQFFAGVGEYNSLHNDAMAIAWKEGKRGKDMAVRVAELIAAPTQEMKATASLAGLYTTFRDPSRIAKAFQTVRTGLNVGQPFGIGSLVLRFPRTPANIAKAVEEYSPFGFLNSLYHVARKTSSAGMAEDAFAKALVGTSGTALGLYLTDIGLMRGTDDPKDKQLNAMNRSLGRQGSSANWSGGVRFFKSWDPADLKERPGDKWVNVGDLQPFGSTILMGANAAKAATRGEAMLSVLQKPNTYFEMIAGATEVLTDSSFVAPLRNFMDPNLDTADAALKIITDAPSGFVPSILNQFAQLDDNFRRYQRDPQMTREMGNHLISRMPLLSWALPKQSNVLGSDDVRYPGGNNAWDVFANPARITEVYSGPQAEILLQVAQHAEKTGQKDIMPAFAKDMAKAAGLNSDQLTEQDVVQMQRQLGMRFKQSLMALQETPEWKNPKGNTPEEREAYKITAMVAAVSKYRNYANKEFFAEYLQKNGPESVRVNKGIYKQMQEKPTVREVEDK